MIVAVAAFIAACGQGFYTTMDIAGFEAQVLAFEDASYDAGKSIVITNLIVRFNSNLQFSNEAGVCYINNPIPYIEINTNYWNHASDTQKEILMFHELGHCILKRQHRNDTANSMPVSIMYFSIDVWATSAEQTYYESNRDTYIRELFN